MKPVPYNVCLINEGYEENEFFRTMNEAGVVSSKICLTPFNAETFSRIAPLFQEYRTSELFDCVLCVYDVDYRQNEPDSPFNQVQDGLKAILGETEAVNAVSFCTNPNFLQIYLLSEKKLDEVTLISTSKTVNTSFVHACWPTIAKPKNNKAGQKSTKDYDAKHWQLRLMNARLMGGIGGYQTLLANTCDLPENYLEVNYPGSNAPKLIHALLEGDIEFFQSINDVLDK